jgi:hypothetical protein
MQMAAERICKAAELLAKVKKQPSPWHVLNEVLDDMCEPDERGKVKDAVYMKMEGARPN